MNFDINQLEPETIARLKILAKKEGLKSIKEAVLFILKKDSRIIANRGRSVPVNG